MTEQSGAVTVPWAISHRGHLAIEAGWVCLACPPPFLHHIRNLCPCVGCHSAIPICLPVKYAAIAVGGHFQVAFKSSIFPLEAVLLAQRSVLLLLSDCKRWTSQPRRTLDCALQSPNRPVPKTHKSFQRTHWAENHPCGPPRTSVEGPWHPSAHPCRGTTARQANCSPLGGNPEIWESGLCSLLPASGPSGDWGSGCSG